MVCIVYENLVYHSGIKGTPYKAIFTADQKVGLATSSMSK